MKFKSVLQLYIDTILEQPQDIKLSKSNVENTRNEYVRLVSGAKKSVKIVTGESNSQLFDRLDLAQGIDSFLADNPDGKFEFIFHKNNNFEIAEKLFKEENEHLFELKRKYGDRVQIYWMNKRPDQHYAVIDDGRAAILEEPRHKPNKPFDATITYDKKWATKWSKTYDKYLDRCVESGHCRALGS